MIIAGDIGGTKTLLGLFSRTQGVKHPLQVEEFPSQKYDSLEKIIAEFLQQIEAMPVGASLAVAGPVIQGRSRVTNLPWIIDSDTIARKTGLSNVHLLNDLQATAAAVPTLEAEDLSVLRAGEPDPTGAIAVVAPGTNDPVTTYT